MKTLTAGLVVTTPELYAELEPVLRELPVRIVFEQTAADDPTPAAERLERMQPDVVLADVAAFPDGLSKFIEIAHRTAAAPAVIALDRAASTESVLTAMRAGASEYLFPPFRGSLEAALERLAASRQSPARAPKGQVLGFVSAKGGLGATTIACHIAVELSRTSAALLVDLDLKNGIAASIFRADPPYSVLDALNHIHRMDENLWKTLVARTESGAYLLSAPMGLVPRDQPQLQHLGRVLRFARSQHAWVIADLGSGVSPTTFQLLDEIDEIYVTTTLEVPALQQAKRLIRNLLEQGMSKARLRLLVNRMPKRADVRLKELEELLGLEVHRTFANDYQRLYDCYAEGRLLNGKGPFGEQISAAARALAGTEVAPKRRGLGLFSN
jgi:pilus assembly protein CpaE